MHAGMTAGQAAYTGVLTWELHMQGCIKLHMPYCMTCVYERARENHSSLRLHK